MEMSRLFGPDWHEQSKRGELTPAYVGNAMRQAQEHAKGLEGAINRLKYSFVDLNSKLYDSGFYTRIEGFADGISHIVKAIGALPPGTLNNLATGMIALAAPVLRFGSAAD